MAETVEAPRGAKGIAVVILLLAALLAIATGAVTWWATSPSQEEIDLKAALVKLRTASSQGIALNPFSELVLDAGTKLALARPHLDAGKLKESEEAVADWEAVKAIWQFTFHPGAKLCPESCHDEIYGPLKQLGMVKDEKDFDVYKAKPENQWGIDPTESGPGHDLVSRALTISAVATDSATAHL